MDVVIVGAHGQIARQLADLLLERGDTVRGVIRSDEQAEELEAKGITPVITDLESETVEDDLARSFHGADAIVFAAGAGPGSTAERKWSVDYGGAVHTAAAAARVDVPRIVILSAMDTDDPPEDESVFSAYLRAKARADDFVRAAGLQHTIVRPGKLTDHGATDQVRAARHVDDGEISRADVAAVLVAVLSDETSAGRTFEVTAGYTKVRHAVAGLADQLDTLD